MESSVQTHLTTRHSTSRLRVLARLFLAIALAAGVGVLLLTLAGVFQAKVPTGKAASLPEVSGKPPSLTEVRSLRRPRFETVVGTVRSTYQTAVASKLLAKVLEVNVKAGQAVTRGDILVRLEGAELEARRKQAEAAVAAARLEKDKAGRDFERAQSLLPGGGISKEDFDHRETARRTTAADLDRAQQLLAETTVFLEFATIRAPMTGIVVDKRVEAGDTVSPGEVLLTLYDPVRMQMVATVRESLAQRLAVGDKVRGRLEALGYDCQATISEIVPESEAASRSFTIKVTGPCPPGVYSGMFGRLYIPLEEEELVVVPAAAVFKVGQLDMVDVFSDNTVKRRSVQLGRRIDEDDEVLAGLMPGEKVVISPGARGAGE